MSKRRAKQSLESLVLGGDFMEVTSMEELNKIVECPICKTIPTGSIYQCQTGHNICGTCRPKMNSCGFCHYAFTDCRNFAVESIVAISTFACTNFSFGCTKRISGSALATHQERCDYRPIKCPQGTLNGCENSVIQFDGFLFHIQSVHFGKLHSSRVGKVVVVTHKLPNYAVQENYSWPLHYFKHDGKVFVIRSFLREGSLHFILALLAADSEAKGYTVRLRMRLPGMEIKLPFRITLPVVPLRTCDFEIIQKKLCMTFTKDEIAKICELTGKQKNNFITWEILYEVSRANLAN